MPHSKCVSFSELLRLMCNLDRSGHRGAVTTVKAESYIAILLVQTLIVHLSCALHFAVLIWYDLIAHRLVSHSVLRTLFFWSRMTCLNFQNT